MIWSTTKKVSVIIFFCLSVSNIFGQKIKIVDNRASHFQIKHKQDTIDFIVVDTILKDKKPIFLFCQGSLPVPIFIKKKERLFMFGGGISNFDIKNIKKHYHLVVLSMPKTPLIVGEKNLNQRYCYIPDSTQQNQLSQAYIQADYLQNYVNRSIKVLKYLKKQKWVDNSKLVVAGHSQGTKVATKIASQYKKITNIGLFAPNPFGRIDEYVRQARLDAQLGKITWKEADKQMQNNYDFFEKVHNPDSLKTKPHLLAWNTFSEPYLDDWLELKIPIYMAYGTEDRTSDLCDIVPLFFIQEKKKNLTFKRYIKLEHNFFEVNEKGVDYDKPRWTEVMNTFVEWTLK